MRADIREAKRLARCVGSIRSWITCCPTIRRFSPSGSVHVVSNARPRSTNPSRTVSDSACARNRVAFTRNAGTVAQNAVPASFSRDSRERQASPREKLSRIPPNTVSFERNTILSTEGASLSVQDTISWLRSGIPGP
jgi:hypothetical protein